MSDVGRIKYWRQYVDKVNDQKADFCVMPALKTGVY